MKYLQLLSILADEMGLGKTIQAITYLTLLKHLHNDPGPHLIVCPASVLENWERELKKWCPSFSILQYHGAARSAYSKELSSLAKAGLPPPFNVLLVCYSLFERHSAQQKDDRKILKRWRWSCVLMDEAHALKDKNSYRWKNLMSVAQNANQRLMLTGTPLQNDLHELWSLLEFMMPDLFATEDVDLKKLLNADDMDLVGRMKSILGPFILRRLKSDVMQQLVPKIQRVEYVIMEKQQEDAYKEAIEDYRAASRARMTKNSEINSTNILGVIPRRQISNYFVQFRKIANHPLLVRRIYRDEDVVRFAKKLRPMGVFGFDCTLDKVIKELKSYNDFSIHRLLLYYGVTDTKGILPDKYVMLSAKCRALAELLPSVKQGGHRVLIFSQWTSMLDILEWTLDVIGVTYKRLDGRYCSANLTFTVCEEGWVKFRNNAFKIAFLGIFLFPTSIGRIDLGVIPLVLSEGKSIIPAILCETMRLLSYYQDQDEGAIDMALPFTGAGNDWALYLLNLPLGEWSWKVILGPVEWRPWTHCSRFNGIPFPGMWKLLSTVKDFWERRFSEMDFIEDGLPADSSVTYKFVEWREEWSPSFFPQPTVQPCMLYSLVPSSLRASASDSRSGRVADLGRKLSDARAELTLRVDKVQDELDSLRSYTQALTDPSTGRPHDIVHLQPEFDESEAVLSAAPTSMGTMQV
uniref:Helicase ATP-binding domain-containing protein n=1 Tax=Fagus sylvatica TaxID=28930 RepID=A0A2N9J7G3_FAGSY